MQEPDWARIYGAMDRRIELKYLQLPSGEQIGKNAAGARPQATNG